MYARAGATPPVSVMLRMNSGNPSGTSENCGAPTRLITPPSRTTPIAISIADLRPTASSTAWVPSPS